MKRVRDVARVEAKYVRVGVLLTVCSSESVRDVTLEKRSVNTQ